MGFENALSNPEIVSSLLGAFMTLSSISQQFHHGKRWLTLILSPILISSNQVPSMIPAPKSSIYAVIDALVASPPRDHLTVERVFGAPLLRVTSGAVDTYQARNIVLDD